MRNLKWLAIVGVLGCSSGASGQERTYERVGDVDFGRLAPNRVELIEHTMTDSGPVVDSWTYVTVDEGQNWSVPSLVIDWMPTTWNGIGQDLNIVRSSDLTLLSRVTPGAGGYSARILESHFHTGRASVIFANPDGAPEGPDGLPWGEAGGLDVKRSGLTGLQTNRFYNEIVLPYLFSAMDLQDGHRYVVPMFSPYVDQGSAFFVAVLVDGEREIRGEDGSARRAQVVRTRRIRTAVEADTVDFGRPAPEHIMYVSDDAPYFLGKTWTQVVDGRTQTFKTWRYLQHETLRISPSNRLEEILEVRNRHIAEEPQELPWDPEIGFR